MSAMTPEEAVAYLQLPTRLQALQYHTRTLLQQRPDLLPTINAELARFARDVLSLQHELS